MNARLWLAIACGGGAGLVWWIAGAEGGFARVAARGREEVQGSARASAELRASGALAELDRPSSTAAAPAPAAAREPSPERGAEDAPAAARVVVRVQLALASGETRSFAAWRVELQSWLQDTDETLLHERAADAAGVAEFVFPGFVHVDWLRCLPPSESGLALGYSEHHEDLAPGERMSATLELEPGGLLVARVVDLAGAPVGGARVHAYSEDYTWDFSSWQPGLLQAVTGADGRAELPPLPPGTWSVGVEPREWLQIDPEPGDSRGEHALEAGQRVEGTELRVTPLHHVRVSVRDAAGRAVAAAHVELAPLELRVGGLAARRPESPDPLALFLGAEPLRADAVGLVWPHGELAWQTDPEGEAEIYGVAGRWALSVTPELGMGAGTNEPVRTEIELPGPDPHVSVPAALAELRGRVVESDGRGLAGAEASLHRADDDDWSTEAKSDADGNFVLRGLPPGIEYWLQLWHAERLPLRTSVWVAGDVAAGTFELRRAGSLRVRLVDPNDAPLQHKALVILAHHPDEALRTAEAEWFARVRGSARQTNESGRVEFARLPPGKVELGLNLPMAAPPNAAGHAGITMSTFQRWIVPVGGEEVRLVADLGGYVAPAAQKLPFHTGVVLDARTGAPLVGAWVVLRSRGSVQQGRTDGDGRFQIVNQASVHGLVVLHSGYLPLEEPERSWPPGVHEHRFALLPGSADLLVEFADRDGERLPRVDVALTTVAGAPLLALGRTGGSYFPLNGQRIGTEGSLTLGALSTERLRFELSIAGHPLGLGEIDATRAGGATSVRLERSLAELRRALEQEQDGDDDEGGDGDDD